MARVAALVPDLLFGSKVVESLGQAGHDVDLVRGEDQARERVAGAAVLVVDLTGEAVDAGGLAEAAREAGAASLAFYSHVDVDTRREAEEAGFDLVVPRSRMAREGAELVDRLVAA